MKQIGGNSDQAACGGSQRNLGFLAPLVFVGVIVLRKVTAAAAPTSAEWNKRLQHEIARWT